VREFPQVREFKNEVLLVLPEQGLFSSWFITANQDQDFLLSSATVGYTLPPHNSQQGATRSGQG
jgi:hypothetical protein